MNICQATKLAIQEGLCIARTTEWWGSSLRLLPTDTLDGFVVFSITGSMPYRGWSPMSQDIVAEDWEVFPRPVMPCDLYDFPPKDGKR